MEFVLITGPPAVGKMTVGQSLSERLDYPLFINHDSIELTLKFFDFGEEGFNKINEGIRELIFKTCAASTDLKGLIFTFVWAFDQQEDSDYVDNLKNLFTQNGGSFYIVELYAPMDIRLDRNKTPNRLKAKPSKRNIAASDKRLQIEEKKYQMNTEGQQIKDKNYLRIDNSNLSPEEVVDQIVGHFRLG